jgi:hypothetical protein
MGIWFRYFVGTPQRFVNTLVAVGIVFSLFRPDVFAMALQNAVTSILMAVMPLMQPILTIVIVVAAIRWILGKK